MTRLESRARRHAAQRQAKHEPKTGWYDEPNFGIGARAETWGTREAEEYIKSLRAARISGRTA